MTSYGILNVKMHGFSPTIVEKSRELNRGVESQESEERKNFKNEGMVNNIKSLFFILYIKYIYIKI